MKYRPEYDLKVIGKNLKRLREMKKLSVAEVQEYLRLGTPQAVYKYESGRGYPQADTMLALMELYEADLHDIVDEHVEIKENPDKQAVDKRTGNDYMIYTKKMGGTVVEVVSIETYKSRRKDHLLKYCELLTKYKAS